MPTSLRHSVAKRIKNYKVNSLQAQPKTDAPLAAGASESAASI